MIKLLNRLLCLVKGHKYKVVWLRYKWGNYVDKEYPFEDGPCLRCKKELK